MCVYVFVCVCVPVSDIYILLLYCGWLILSQWTSLKPNLVDVLMPLYASCL